MSLKVIGAGWGRTGTESLKKALEILGFNKCYHMFELIKDGKRVVYWEQLIRGEKPDYEKLFEGYQAAVDFPAAMHYRALMEHYPDAKIILSYRDPEKWYESASNTIFKPLPFFLIPVSRVLGVFIKNLSYLPRIAKNVIDPLFADFFEGRKDDRAYMLKRYNDWVAEVKRTVPAERLLVHEAREGWEPLCAFLGVPVPDVPYPRGNDSEQFKERTKVRNLVKEFGGKD